MIKVSHIVNLTNMFVDTNMSRNYEHQKPSYKRSFVPICHINGQTGHIKPPNTSEDNSSSFLYYVWGPRWIQTMHTLTWLSFILASKVSCVSHTKSQSLMDIVWACNFEGGCVGSHHLPPGEDLSHKKWIVYANWGSPTIVTLNLFPSNPKTVLWPHDGHVYHI